MNFSTFTPHQLRKAIEIELQKTDDVKVASITALKRLNEDPGYYEDMTKAKKMPVGTVSKGYKKVAEGKWVKVKEDKKKNEKGKDHLINIKKFDTFNKDTGKKEYIIRFSDHIEDDIKEGVSYHQTGFHNVLELASYYMKYNADRPEQWWERNYDIYSYNDIENMDEDSDEFQQLLKDAMDIAKDKNSEIIDYKKMSDGTISLVQSGLNGYAIDANNVNDALNEAIKIINKNKQNYGEKAYLISTDIIDTIEEGITFNAQKSDILAEISLNKTMLKARTHKYYKRIPKPSGNNKFFKRLNPVTAEFEYRGA